MFNKRMYSIIFTTLFLIAGGVHADTIIIGSDADTYMRDDIVRGAEEFMDIRGAGYDFGGYLRFDLAAHNVLAVESATLTLITSGNASRNDRAVEGRFSLYGLNNVAGNTPQNWDETVLTEGNVGIEWTTNNGDPLVNVTDLDDDVEGITETIVEVGSYGDPGSTTITVTGDALVSFIQSRIDDNGLVTFIVRNDDGTDRGYGLATKENANEDFRPKLELTAKIGAKILADNPKPQQGAVDVPRDVILSWTPGVFADKHDVYLGTSFDDVNAAMPTVDPNSVYLGQIDPNFYPDSGTLRLEFDQRYYWRIDEVNAPPDTTTYTGKVWSFTTEPLAIAIPGDLITATADSNAPGQGPENTINGSGLDENDLHSTETSDMWLTAKDAPGPAWIKYEFDKPYQLHQMLVWNYNGVNILYIYGLKEITVEYSTDGTNWTQIESISEFPQAPGDDGYASDITVEFGGVAATYVRITANSNWDVYNLYNQYGLSEVRFTAIPASARGPSPDDQATDVSIDVTLGWRAGREAAEHNVYISADEQAVIDGTVPFDTVSQTSYGPLSLDLGSRYFWRVDEVNSAEATPIWQGSIWSFTTNEYLVVDDFESYNDIEEGAESNLVYMTWSDGGYGAINDPTNGSTIGYLTAPSMETDIVHGGNQSVPVTYDNTAANLSEVTVSPADLTIGSDWTVRSPEMLSLWFYGDPNNAPEQMYVKLNGVKVTYNADLTQEDWQQLTIDLTSFGIDLSNVTSLTIGFERTGTTGGSGMVFIDDIQLYTPVDDQAVLAAWQDE